MAREPVETRLRTCCAISSAVLAPASSLVAGALAALSTRSASSFGTLRSRASSIGRTPLRSST